MFDSRSIVTVLSDEGQRELEDVSEVGKIERMIHPVEALKRIVILRDSNREMREERLKPLEDHSQKFRRTGNKGNNKLENSSSIFVFVAVVGS